MDTMVADPLVGRTVDGRYRVDSRIAVGGMASVYRATDLRLDRLVALKVMLPSFAEDPEFVTRFQMEARAAARLSNPNVVAVFDQGQSGDQIYLAMEYVPGRTLRDVLKSQGAVTPEQALAIIDPVLQALQAAHHAGFVHRDIKPENVLLTAHGDVKVTDFGLARALQTPSAATRGLLIGTAAYLAPEHVSNGVSDERSDVYQAGILLYELLTGATPHTGENAWTVAYNHVNTDVPHVRQTHPSIPAELDQLVADATLRDAATRVATASSFLARVRAIAATLPPPLPLASPNDTLVVPNGSPLAAEAAPGAAGTGAPAIPGWRRPSRRRWRKAFAVTLIIAVATAAIAWTLAVRPFDRTDIPSLAGMTQSRATKLLESSGFAVETTDRGFSETTPAGRVLGTDPVAGESARTGSTVFLIVSLGPERYAVPKVARMTPEEAADRLAESHLAVGPQIVAYHDTIAPGLVTGTKPAVGTEVKPDTSISLVISKGPAPVKIPALRGMSEEAASAALDKLGLKITTTTAISERIPKGDVIKSAPRPGQTVPRGSEVALTISEGPPPVIVPNVVDMPRAQAIALIQAAGLSVNIQEGIVTPLDRVYSQDPPGGTSIPKGSTVTLSIF